MGSKGSPLAGSRGRAPGLKPGTPGEVFLAFLRLGLTSFGGPVAHLGYFRAEFVERRQWLSDAAFAELVGLCQFLPGPASSQTGFAIGLMRAGAWGGLAAWAGFTLPSAAILVVFAREAGGLSGSAAGAGLLHGLQLVAVAIVAQAVWNMARSLCPDRVRSAIALAAIAIVTGVPGPVGQLLAIALGGLGGLLFCRSGAVVSGPLPALLASRRVGVAWLVLFGALLVVPPLLGGRGVAVFDAFYRCGALVFGGGHVVLPLLRDAVVGPGWVSEDTFLAGYGAAQAVPGPLFTFAAFLGAVLHPGPSGVVGAAVALVAIFLPGLLLLVGVLPFWASLRTRPWAQAGMRGLNAAVVGVLGAALYDPVWVTAVRSSADFVVAVVGFVLLTVWRVAPLWVVLLGAVAGVVLT